MAASRKRVISVLYAGRRAPNRSPAPPALPIFAGMKRRPGWLTLTIVLGVVPFVCAVVVHKLIFEVFGNGHFIPYPSTGTRVLDFWSDQGGMYLTPAIVAFCVLLARRASLPAALLCATLAALSTFVILIAAFIWAVVVEGASLG
jgi:hypothetical protein